MRLRGRGLRGRIRARLRRGHGRLTGSAAELLDEPGGRAVLLLADPACRDAVRGWLHTFSRDDVTVLSADGVLDLDDVVARASRLNAPDVILVVLGPAALDALARNHARLFQRLFLHLRPGGAYVVDRTVEATGNRDTGPDRVQHRFRRILTTGRRRDGEVGLTRREIAVARCVGDVVVADDLVVATKRGRHALKVRECEVGELLRAREPGIEMSVLETRPAGRLDPRIEEASYGPSRLGPWPARLEYPELALRHYTGEIVSVGGMRLRAGNTILPESFRWPMAKVLSHPRNNDVTPLFARLDQRPPAGVLDGDYYYLDCLFSGHFGHLTTEVVSRLWGWERAKREIPGLKVLFHTNPSNGADGALERRLFTAYGIAESDLAWSDRPVRLRSVVGASPMWHNHEPFYAHPDIRETWARLTSGLLAGAAPAGHERIFVSRGASLSNRRGCRNQQEVERFFADRGYHVFCPEELPLEEQVALFAGARVVAGFAGSAMFNLMHTRRLEAVVLLSHNTYAARNEHLFTSVLGGQLHYFWQQPDVAPPRAGRSKAADRSSFAVDFAACGDDLARVLGGL